MSLLNILKPLNPLYIFESIYANYICGVFGISKPKAKHQEIDIKTYAKYILKEGTNQEKSELAGCFKSKLKMTKEIVTLE